MFATWSTGVRAPSSARLCCSSCSSSNSSTTSERSCRIWRAPFMSITLPMMLVGMPRMSTAPRTPIAFVKKSARIPPAKPPMNTTYMTPIAVPRPRNRYGHTAWSTGVTIANAQAVSTACGMPQITNHTLLWVDTCSGVNKRRRQDQQSDDHERLRRILAVGAVEVRTDGIEERHRDPAREAQNEAALQDAVDADACRTGTATAGCPSANSPKPSAANAAIAERIVAIFFNRVNAASIDGCAGCSSSMTSPSTSSFSYWPRGGSFIRNARPATSSGGDAEHHERPAPPLGGAVSVVGEGGDDADEQRAEVAEHLLAEVHDRRHPRPDPDRVVVGDQRRVHRDVVGLA